MTSSHADNTESEPSKMLLSIHAATTVEELWAALQRVMDEQATGFPGVPTAFAMLVQMKDLDPACFDSVRYVTNTAAALPPAHILRLRDLFRKARIYSMYGVTECKRVTYLPPEELDRRPTSVGRGMPNEEVYIVDENDKPVGPGEIGELVVRGSNVMKGYWDNPEGTRTAIKDGWLHTGDVGMVDEEGYLYIFDRKKDMIICGGYNIYPIELEELLYENPKVLEAAVIGVRDENMGEIPKAFIVLQSNATATKDEIMDYVKNSLAKYKKLREVEFVDELPKGPTGKILRRRLREKKTEC